MNLFLSLFILLISSCGTYRSIKSPMKEYKKYDNDLVSVQTALNLARTSYILGCTKAKDRNFSHKECVNKANKHVEENIIFILEKKE